jgi:hypothetical protein
VTSLIGIENIDPILEKIDINDVWGVGKQLTKFYQKMEFTMQSNSRINLITGLKKAPMF